MSEEHVALNIFFSKLAERAWQKRESLCSQALFPVIYRPARMPSPLSGSDRQILLCATQYAALVAEYRVANRCTKESLRPQMNGLLDKARLEIEAEKSRRLSVLAPHIQQFVRDRNPFNCRISASEAEAVRHCYATPPALGLDVLSGADLISLGDLFEGWAHNDRLDPRAMIELFGWCDGMRILAQTVGNDYAPLPLPAGAKVPLLKFLVNQMRTAGET